MLMDKALQIIHLLDKLYILEAYATIINKYWKKNKKIKIIIY